MRTSVRGLQLITQREGKIMHVYRDSKRLPTAGVGHLLLPDEKARMPVGTPITEKQCQDWLKSDVGGCENVVNGIGEKLGQHEFDACVSLAFNIGEHGFATSTVARRLKAGNHAGAAEAILLWKKPPEIIGRRRGEYHQFKTPYPKTLAAAPASTDDAQSGAGNDEIAAPGPTPGGPTLAGQPPPPPAISTTVEQTEMQNSAGQSASSTTTTEQQNVVIESREKVGFFQTIWKKITGLAIFNGGLTGVTDQLQQIQAFGMSASFWHTIFYIGLGASLIYLAYEGYQHWSRISEAKERDRVLASVNSTPMNTVCFASAEDLAAFEKLGYKVIRR